MGKSAHSHWQTVSNPAASAARSRPPIPENRLTWVSFDSVVGHLHNVVFRDSLAVYKIPLEDQNHLDRMVHFFLYDYRFERVWKNPEADIEKLSRYRAVLSPDFSMYLEMAPVMQMYNVFRNRWCGAYWASKGIRVIPTVN